MKYRVSVLVDGERETSLAREQLQKNTAPTELNSYDGLVTGWATETEVQALRKSGLHVDCSPAVEPDSTITDLVKSLPQKSPAQVCVKFRGPMRPGWRELMKKLDVHVMGKTGYDTYKLHATPEAVAELHRAQMLTDAETP